MPLLRSQKYAAEAYGCVNSRLSAVPPKYKAFAKKFPALIHTCGLAQAVAFAGYKPDYKKNLEDLKTVMNTPELEKLAKEGRDALAYLRLSREAIQAAGWLKRYAEALIEGEGE